MNGPADRRPVSFAIRKDPDFMDERFLRNEMLWGPKAQARLAQAHVIVFGLGGVGIADINPDAVLHPMEALYSAESRARFFPEGCRYDYIVDAIDLVSCKLDLAETARRLGIPLIMALGTGNKLDPSQLRLADIAETYGCPLARVMRKELRNRGILRQTVVFSPEKPAPTVQLEAPPPGRRSVPASNPWVPATAGLLIGSKVIRDLIAQGGKESC